MAKTMTAMQWRRAELARALREGRSMDRLLMWIEMLGMGAEILSKRGVSGDHASKAAQLRARASVWRAIGHAHLAAAVSTRWALGSPVLPFVGGDGREAFRQAKSCERQAHRHAMAANAERMERMVDAACACLQDLPRRGESQRRPCGDERARVVVRRVLAMAQEELGQGMNAHPVGLAEGGVSLAFYGPKGAEVVFILPEDGAWVWTFCDDGQGCEWSPDPDTGEAGWRVGLAWLAAVRRGQKAGLREAIGQAAQAVGERGR